MAVGVIDMKVRFKLDNRELTLDFRRVPFMKWAELKQATGFVQRTIMSALEDGDLDAVMALVWLERTQRERKLNFVDVRQEIANAPEFVDFEITDVILKGKSLLGNDNDDQTLVIEAAELDPTNGS